MARKDEQAAILSALRHGGQTLTRAEIAAMAGPGLPVRTLRRWLSDWTASGVLERTGVGRSTHYRYRPVHGVEEPSLPAPHGYLRGLDEDLRHSLLDAIRDVWTHTSTALEGNTLTLGDTHFLLEEGITVDGKPLKDHEEVTGHARAIDLLYAALDMPLTESLLFDLHKAVQSEKVTDIYKPNGAWKVEPNGTHVPGPEGRPVFLEYAAPADVPVLMSEILTFVNNVDIGQLTIGNAQETYAKIHAGIGQVHPFWDGNGRIARLVANVPLLRAGLPPLTIAAEKRRQYIEILVDYNLNAGQLTAASGAWPDSDLLAGFASFCNDSYAVIRELVEEAFDVQAKRARQK